MSATDTWDDNGEFSWDDVLEAADDAHRCARDRRVHAGDPSVGVHASAWSCATCEFTVRLWVEAQTGLVPIVTPKGQP